MLATAEGWWLVDAGPRSPRWDAGEGAVLPFLRWAGVRRLRALVLTHDDGDHTGGAAAVVRALRPERVVGPAPVAGAGDLRRRFPRLHPVAAGDTLRAATPRVRAAWPPRQRDPRAERGDNAASLVLCLEDAATTVWLLADVDSVVEAVLAPPHRAWLVKAGHHGSGSSSGVQWLRRTAPARVLVSCGRRNRYGHPAPRVLAAAAAVGAAVDRTDHHGAMAYRFGPGGPERLASAWHLPRPGATRPAAGAPTAPRAW
jgi:competence protein ComEC